MNSKAKRGKQQKIFEQFFPLSSEDLSLSSPKPKLLMSTTL